MQGDSTLRVNTAKAEWAGWPQQEKITSGHYPIRALYFVTIPEGLLVTRHSHMAHRCQRMCNHDSHTFLQAARRVKRECPGIDVQVFSDRDIADKRSEMEAALQGADVFFGSLLFDYDQVTNASPHPHSVPSRTLDARHCNIMRASFKDMHSQASYRKT